MMKYHITKESKNVKTGKILVTTTSEDSCPPSCPFNGRGCYAESVPLAIHWRKVSSGERGGNIAELILAISALESGSIWRHNQAGDLSGKGEHVDGKALSKIVLANTGKRGFTYTHKYAKKANHAHIKAANDGGFTINLSANSLSHADELFALGIGPVVTVLPESAIRRNATPDGRMVYTCPATYNDAVNCANCGICAKADRKFIIGFPAHGSGKKAVSEIAKG